MSRSEQRQRTGRLPPVRCYVEDEKRVRTKAADCGVSVGQFMLTAALGKRTRSKVDSHTINELRRLGGLQKHLFREGGGVQSREFMALLLEIQAAITRIAR